MVQKIAPVSVSGIKKDAKAAKLPVHEDRPELALNAAILGCCVGSMMLTCMDEQPFSSRRFIRADSMPDIDISHALTACGETLDQQRRVLNVRHARGHGVS